MYARTSHGHRSIFVRGLLPILSLIFYGLGEYVSGSLCKLGVALWEPIGAELCGGVNELPKQADSRVGPFPFLVVIIMDIAVGVSVRHIIVALGRWCNVKLVILLSVVCIVALVILVHHF